MKNKRALYSFSIALALILSISLVSAIGVSVGSDVKVHPSVTVSSETGDTIIHLPNGNNVTLGITSESAKEHALANLKVDSCSNCTVELVEVKVNGEAKAAYRVTSTQKVKILGIFNANMDSSVDVDAETGATLDTNKPWWAFMASESRSEAESDAETTVDNSEDTEASAEVDASANADWCNGDYAKDVYAAANANSGSVKVVEAKGLGFVNYKGKSACHVYVKVEFDSGGAKGTSETDVYSYDHASEKENLNAWVTSKTVVSGQVFTYDYHWLNGKCTEGSGCDLANMAG